MVDGLQDPQTANTNITETSLEVEEKLQLLIDDLIASLDVNELDANQCIKMLQIALQITLPRMKQATYEVVLGGGVWGKCGCINSI